jgi:hypothetical protein
MDLNGYAIWDHLTAALPATALEEIASFDLGLRHGDVFEGHLAALRRIFDTGFIPDPLRWVPSEGLSLASWDDYEGQDDRALRTLFACVVLLGAWCDGESRQYLSSPESRLILAVDCACQLGGSWPEELLDYLAALYRGLGARWREAEWTGGHILAYPLGCLILSCHQQSVAPCAAWLEETTDMAAWLRSLNRYEPDEHEWEFLDGSLRLDLWKQHLRRCEACLEGVCVLRRMADERIPAAKRGIP